MTRDNQLRLGMCVCVGGCVRSVLCNFTRRCRRLGRGLGRDLTVSAPRLSELEVGHRDFSQEWLSCGQSVSAKQKRRTGIPCDFLLSAQAAHPTPDSNCAGRRPNAWALPWNLRLWPLATAARVRRPAQRGPRTPGSGQIRQASKEKRM